MRKFLFGFFLALAVTVVVGFVVTSPWVMDAGIRLTCWTPSERCTVRMRSMGHVWSRWGYLQRAKYWYARGADQGDRAAMFHLAWVHEEEGLGELRGYIREEYGTPGMIDMLMAGVRERLARWRGEPLQEKKRRLSLAKNAEALVWYRKSAELGFAPAMNNLGQLLLNGSLGYRDLAEAFSWHLAAAEAGSFVGAMNVGFSFRSGHGVAPDAAAAARWSEWKASAASSPDLPEPTFGRTFLYGRNALPASQRQQIRMSAQRGEPVTMSVGTLTPSDKLPTFESVRQGLRK